MLHMLYIYAYTHMYIEGRLKIHILNVLELSASGGRAMSQEVIKRAMRRV